MIETYYHCPRCGYCFNKLIAIKKHIYEEKCESLLSNLEPKDCLDKALKEVIKHDKKKDKVDPYKIIKDLRRKNHELFIKNMKLTTELSRYRAKNGGYIYVLQNSAFNEWGDNVFKIGCSRDTQKRLAAYTTAYITPSTIVHTSQWFDDKFKAEKYLFKSLEKYRITNNREFFKAELKHIILEIKKMEYEFNFVILPSK